MIGQWSWTQTTRARDRLAGASAGLFPCKYRLGSAQGWYKLSTVEISNSFSEEGPRAWQHTGAILESRASRAQASSSSQVYHSLGRHGPCRNSEFQEWRLGVVGISLRPKSFGPCMYHSLQILIYRQEASHSPTQHSSEGTGTVRRHLSEVVLDFNICIWSLNPPAVPAGLPTVCHRFSQDGTWDHRPLKEWRPVTQTFKGPGYRLADLSGLHSILCWGREGLFQPALPLCFMVSP